MAWTRELPSGRFQAIYRDAEGRTRSAGSYPRETQALGKAVAAEEKERANPTDFEAARITWGEWEPRWQAGRRVAASTKFKDEGRLETHVRPKWSGVKLRDITRHSVQTWLRELEEDGKLSPSSCIKCYHLLSSSLKAAVAARMLGSSPCVGVVLPKAGQQVDRFLADWELAELKYELGTRDELTVDVLVGTGMRLGEMLGLHWESVDLAHNTIAITRSWDPIGQQIKPTKSYQNRTVPISKTLAKALAKELATRGPGRPSPVAYDRKCAAHTGLVFPGFRGVGGVKGRPMDGDNFRHRWEQAHERANARLKAAEKSQIPKARVHDLRHTYASRLVQAGVPLAAVKDLLGHASIVTTQRYAHLANTQWDAVRAVLGDTGTPTGYVPRAADRAAK